MQYRNIVEGRFLSRPNRFIAFVETEEGEQICHVKNTGRCQELLLPGATVYLEKSGNPKRKTAWDLVAVRKGERLFNLDSSAPNAVAGEYLRACFPDALVFKPEKVYGNSRMDFYVETAEKKYYIEVKGVTLEDRGRALFPDAPTERGLKHIRELIRAKEEGYGAVLLFVLQMKGCRGFCPNDRTDAAFGRALREARRRGVLVKAVECTVEKDRLYIDAEVPLLF